MNRLNISGSVQKFWNWLTLADYEAAKDQGTNDIIARFGRGNINFQNRSVLEDSDLRILSEAGDKAMANIIRRRIFRADHKATAKVVESGQFK